MMDRRRTSSHREPFKERPVERAERSSRYLIDGLWYTVKQAATYWNISYHQALYRILRDRLEVVHGSRHHYPTRPGPRKLVNGFRYGKNHFTEIVDRDDFRPRVTSEQKRRAELMKSTLLGQWLTNRSNGE